MACFSQMSFKVVLFFVFTLSAIFDWLQGSHCEAMTDKLKLIYLQQETSLNVSICSLVSTSLIVIWEQGIIHLLSWTLAKIANFNNLSDISANIQVRRETDTHSSPLTAHTEWTADEKGIFQAWFEPD